MGQRLEAVATEVTFLEAAEAIRRAWERLPEDPPSNEALAVLLAQSALETGHWTKSYCYNLGNAKAHSSWEGDYCYYFADEIVSAAQAQSALLEKAPRTDGESGHNVVVRALSSGRAQVTLYPDHSWCRFRAFRNLDDGARDYLELLYRRFRQSWPAVRAGDPAGFVRALKAQHYFTASIERYLPPVVSLFGRFKKELEQPQLSAAPPLLPTFPVEVGDRPTLRPLKPDPHVKELQRILLANGYKEHGLKVSGIFDAATKANVEIFQLQHIDRLGRPLDADGVVGEKTWWALLNPSGEAQKNHLSQPDSTGLTEARAALMAVCIEEHQKPVFESPDGSNRSESIDAYWPSSEFFGLPWCCAFVSWALKRATGKLPIGDAHHIGVQRMWLAAKKLGMKTDSPKPGDVFIQIMSGGKGHTGFVVSVSENGQTIYTCEGNVGNRLKLGQRDRSTIHHFIDCLQDGQSNVFPRRSDLTFVNLDHEETR